MDGVTIGRRRAGPPDHALGWSWIAEALDI
jgi:hypothetical protein